MAVLNRVIYMVFVDSLAVMLLGVGVSSVLIAMYMIMVAMGKKQLSQIAVPAMVLGIFDAVSGFYISFAWPLPAAYNMLFGDPMLFLGLFMVMGGYMLYKNIDIKLLSIPGALFGIYMLVEMVAIFTLHLESGQDLLPSLGLYGFAGLSALLSPLVYSGVKGNGKYAYYLLALLLILTAFIALIIGYGAIYSHLASPP